MKDDGGWMSFDSQKNVVLVEDDDELLTMATR